MLYSNKNESIQFGLKLIVHRSVRQIGALLRLIKKNVMRVSVEAKEKKRKNTPPFGYLKV
jgi:hypothetical protein